MKKIGLTGGIGSGKSTVAKLLADAGFAIVDADKIAREIMEPGSPVLDDVAAAFGDDLIRADGSLDRGELARRAFVDKRATEKLNSITHPAIRAESERRFAAAEAAGEPAVVYDMPLLVELGMNRDMDLTIVVDVDAEERVRRLTSSRGLDEADARARIAQQIDAAERNAAADVIIDNNGDLSALKPQVDALVERLRA
ncbi:MULTISPECIES: dephospho-CoA kinase [unclassified Corynebacterium]|uniref:dephospho-CoA kinase n=1 Tax=unclassified Corynebacterium TaxID=2624378 RepID=UPI002653D5CB|nr:MULTISPECIES: dephospho-CoA kinase [unclassified Corynebacterium]MDN8594631.1 dephospho-CoA kinase [Corynebacterium sp. P4_F2]WKK56162.1 dephospho-CoA kinase [Corynebacterium sp. P4-C1]WKK63574.1 dephospho-CoA kinase [Corynebacterium sp. P8-C1]